MAEEKIKTSLVKVRCSSCGHISWWAKKSPYICVKCGSQHGMIINLARDALHARRVEVQRKLANQGRIDAFLSVEG